MFIYSVRARTVKLFALALLAVVLVMLVAVFGGENFVSAATDAQEIDYSGIKTNEDRVGFIERFGIKVADTPTEEEAFTMPENLDRVILGYNELQKKQGLDLTKYRNKRVTRYTYKVENYDYDGDVYANLFIWRGRVVACDISSADPNGFVAPLTQVDASKLK